MNMKLRFDHLFFLKSLWAAIFGLVLLTACATTAPPTSPQTPTQAQTVVVLPPPVETPDPVAPVITPEPSQEAENSNRNGLTPPHMQGRELKRLALILPFSARSSRLRDEANSMLKAAELAIFSQNETDTLLIPLDTQGTPEGATAATKQAVAQGADVILGPILARSVVASSREARKSNTPLIAFSTDQMVAGNGTYLLSFPPEAEVKRIVEYIGNNGTSRFAFFGPDSAYGRRVKTAYESSIRQIGGQVSASETYNGDDISVMQAPAKRLAEYHLKVEAENKLKLAQMRANGGNVIDIPPLAFEAILLPEGGTALRSLAPLLPYYDIDPSDVQFLGTGLWQREETVREPALDGGLFAGPDQEARATFLSLYDRTYGTDPSRLASLAYDAVNFGQFVADGDVRLRRSRLEDPRGFYGVDGLVRFGPAGIPERGLAVYQIKNGRFIIVDPAPKTVSEPSRG